MDIIKRLKYGLLRQLAVLTGRAYYTVTQESDLTENKRNMKER